MASRLAKMARDLIDVDKERRMIVSAHDLDEGHAFVTQQDTTRIEELNREYYKEYDSHSRWGDGDLVARVPTAVIEQLMREKPGFLRDKKAVKEWLNDPDNRVWRTRPGRV